MATSKRDVPQNIFIITHIKSGYYHISIAGGDEFNMVAYIKRCNELAAQSSSMRVINYPLKHFVDTNAPLSLDDFKVERVSTGLPDFKAANVAALRHIERLGGNKLITIGYLEKNKWPAYGKAHEAVMKARYPKKVAVWPNALRPVTVILAEYEDAGYDVQMSTQACINEPTTWQLMVGPELHGIPFVSLTVDKDGQTAKCHAAKRVSDIFVTLKLPVKNLRTYAPDVIAEVKFHHYGPSFESVVQEMDLLIANVLALHNPESVYSYYE